MKYLCCLAFVLFIYSGKAQQSGAKRPNIIFILTDDQRDKSFSGMGHPWVKTPNVDKLLSSGTWFANNYMAEPTCNPSRASLLLGTYERVSRLGFSSTHNMTRAQWQESFPALLHKAGYQTAFAGKWHVNVKKSAQNKDVFDGLFDFAKGHNGHGPFYFTNPDKRPGQPELITTNRHHTNSALEFIDRADRNKPFCLWLCYATPHGSKVKSMHENVSESASKNPRLKDHPIFGGLYRNKNIPYPLQHPENPYDHIPKNVMDQDKGRSATYAYDYNPVSNREHHYRYYQMITELDQMIGEVVQSLKKQGLDKNTIIIFCADNGLVMGEYGMAGKSLLYDLSVKTPCFVYDPTVADKTGGQVRKEIVSSLDITATILDYAGVKPARFMKGSSLRPLISSKSAAPGWRKGLVLENLYIGRDSPLQEGYVTEDGWKYIRCYDIENSVGLGAYTEDELNHKKGKPIFEMLFNLKEDPNEKRNLINESAYTEVLEKLSKRTEEDIDQMNKQREVYYEKYIENSTSDNIAQ